MRNSIEIFNNTLALLRANSLVNIRTADIADPVSPDVISRVEELMNVYLSDEIKDFYLSSNGFTIEWQIDASNSEPEMYGWINIWTLETMIAGENGDLDINEDSLKLVFEEMLILDHHEDEERAELEKHRILESHWGTASYTTVRFEQQEGISLYFVDNYQQYRLPLNFSAYIEFTAESLGLDGCRSGLKHKDFFKNPYLFDKRLQKLKTIFPSTDLCKIPSFCSK